MKITEIDYYRTLEDLLTLTGWLWQHHRPARKKNGEWVTAITGTVGHPDYIAVHPSQRRHMIIEIKSEGKQPTAEQIRWLDAYASVEMSEVYLVHPFEHDEMVEIATLGHVPNLIERAGLKTAWLKEEIRKIQEMEGL